MTSFNFVEREYTSGSQGGTDYGSKPLMIIARSPQAVLLWMPGHSYFGGIGHRAYASAYMMLIKHRKLGGWDRRYQDDFKHDQNAPSTRLTAALIQARAARINEFFEADVAEQIASAVKTRQTVLIDGGGEALRKDHTFERKKARDKALKIASEANVARSVTVEGMACCRQCGMQLEPRTHKHWLDDEDEQPISLEDLQRRFNDKRVLAVGPHLSPEKAHMIGTYTTWDGDTYHNGPYFCDTSCAEAYAERAIKAYAPLPIVPVKEQENC